MKKQYAVFGLGSFGESVAIELQKLGCEVVAIDANMERVEAVSYTHLISDASYLHLDGYDGQAR